MKANISLVFFFRDYENQEKLCSSLQEYDQQKMAGIIFLFYFGFVVWKGMKILVDGMSVENVHNIDNHKNRFWSMRTNGWIHEKNYNKTNDE